MPIRARGLSPHSPIRHVFAGYDRALVVCPVGGNNNVVDGTNAASTTAPGSKTLLASSVVAGRLYVPGAVTLLVSLWTTTAQTIRTTAASVVGTVTIVGRNQFGEDVSDVLNMLGVDTIRTSNAYASVLSVTLSPDFLPAGNIIEVSTRTDVNAVAGTEAVARVGAPFKLAQASDFLGYAGLGLAGGTPVNLTSTYNATYHTFDITDVGITLPQVGYALLKVGAAENL